MSIATPSWGSIATVARPVFSPIVGGLETWQRIPQIVVNSGVGFGQGGFGQGGFGGGQVQSGVPQPVWTPWTTD